MECKSSNCYRSNLRNLNFSIESTWGWNLKMRSELEPKFGFRHPATENSRESGAADFCCMLRSRLPLCSVCEEKNTCAGLWPMPVQMAVAVIYLSQVPRALPVAWTATDAPGFTMLRNVLTASRAATTRAVAARGSCRSAVRQRKDETGAGVCMKQGQAVE